MTTKAKMNECVTLGAVSEAVAECTDIAGAREHYGHLVGRTVIVCGAEVLKRVSRHEHLKLWLKPVDSPLSVFAEFTRERDAARVAERKVRKSSKVSVIGELVSFGYQAVCLNNCRLVENDGGRDGFLSSAADGQNSRTRPEKVKKRLRQPSAGYAGAITNKR